MDPEQYERMLAIRLAEDQEMAMTTLLFGVALPMKGIDEQQTCN